MVTKGQRRIGRTIRKIENSIEFSAKESCAKVAETKIQKHLKSTSDYSADSPIQNLRDLALNKKEDKNQIHSAIFLFCN